MNKRHPYHSTTDNNYSAYLAQALTEVQKSLLVALKHAEGSCIVDKNLAQLAREMHRSTAELRRDIHSLLNSGLITAEGSNESARYYKLSRAGEWTLRD